MASQIEQVADLLNQAALAGTEGQEQTEEGDKEEEVVEEAVADQAEGSDGEDEVDIEDDEVEFLRLHELAEKYDIEPDELFQARVKLGDDPDAPVVSIEQVKDAWKRANKALSEFDGIRSAIDQQRGELDQQRAQMQLWSQLQVPPNQEEQDAFFEFQEMERLEKNSDWWSQLEKQSGIEAARQALNRVRDAKRAAEGKLQGYANQREQHQQQVMQQLNQSFEGELMRRMPSWSDAAVSKTEFESMAKIAAEYGVGQQELLANRDARLWQMVNDLAKLKGLATNKPRPKQKLRKGRRQGGGRTSKTERAKAQVEKQMADAKKSGDIRQQAAAVTALLRG